MSTGITVYVGIRGAVVALDRATGTIVWSTTLKGSDFVTVTVSANEIYAAARGELYCLDPATGQVIWHNPLMGYGTGLVTIAVAGAQSDQVAPVKKRRNEQAAATAAAGAAR